MNTARLPVALARARTAYGLLLLLAPDAARRLLAMDATVPGSRVLRLLGGRQVLQGAVTLVWPARPVLTAGAVVDGVHALTAVAYAAAGGPRRRAGTTSAVLSAAAAGLTLLVRPGPAPREQGRQARGGRRDAVATDDRSGLRLQLALLLGGPLGGSHVAVPEAAEEYQGLDGTGTPRRYRDSGRTALSADEEPARLFVEADGAPES